MKMSLSEIICNELSWFCPFVMFMTLNDGTFSPCPRRDTAGQTLCGPQETILCLSPLGFHVVRMFAPPGLHTRVVYLCHHSAGGGMPIFNRLVIMLGLLFVKPFNCWLERLTGSYLRGGHSLAVIMCVRIRKRVCKCMGDTEKNNLIESDWDRHKERKWPNMPKSIWTQWGSFSQLR